MLRFITKCCFSRFKELQKKKGKKKKEGSLISSHYEMNLQKTHLIHVFTLQNPFSNLCNSYILRSLELFLKIKIIGEKINIKYIPTQF